MDDHEINPIQIQKFLGGVDYPANKDELRDRAQQNGAPEDVLNAIDKLPGEEFQTPADVSEALGNK